MFNKEELELLKNAVSDKEWHYTQRYLEFEDEGDEHYLEFCKRKASQYNELFYKILEKLI